jgi:hypothetical protein
MNLATLNLDGLPADLLVQLDQIGALQHSSASMTTGTISNSGTTKRRARRGDVVVVGRGKRIRGSLGNGQAERLG